MTIENEQIFVVICSYYRKFGNPNDAMHQLASKLRKDPELLRTPPVTVEKSKPATEADGMYKPHIYRFVCLTVIPQGTNSGKIVAIIPSPANLCSIHSNRHSVDIPVCLSSTVTQC